MTREERAAFWQERVAEQRASGENLAAWCRAHQVDYHRMWYWSRRLKTRDDEVTAASVTATPEWVSVGLNVASDGAPHGLQPSDRACASPLRVRVGDVSIEVQRGFDPEALLQLVDALAAR